MLALGALSNKLLLKKDLLRAFPNTVEGCSEFAISLIVFLLLQVFLCRNSF